MADMFMMGSLAVGAANVVLAAVLLVVYRGVHAKTKAPFSLALILFAAAFLLHNALLVYAYATMMEVVSPAIGPYMLGVGSFEAIGLAAMLWTATR
jgi:hypothetical protein